MPQGFLAFVCVVLSIVVMHLAVTPAKAQQPATVNYEYDELGRLIKSTYGDQVGDPKSHYVYDPAGNRRQTAEGVNIADLPPVAIDDFVTTAIDMAVTFDPLLNDVDLNDDVILIASVTTPSAGAVVIGTSLADLTYTPNSGFAGQDSFEYTISDGNGGEDTATVRVSVSENTPPVATDDILVAQSGIPVSIDPRANDTDEDGQLLMVVSTTTPDQGSISILGGGTSIRYQANAGYTGNDFFNYTVSDGAGGTATARVDVTVSQAPTSGAVLLTDTSGDITGQAAPYYDVDRETGSECETYPATEVSPEITLCDYALKVQGTGQDVFTAINYNLVSIEPGYAQVNPAMVGGVSVGLSIEATAATFDAVSGLTTANISIGNRTVTEGANASFTVTRSGKTTSNVSVDYTTSSGTAVAGNDFVAQSGVITFAEGQTSKTITVSTEQDTDFETSETFTVVLSNPTSGASIVDGSGLGTITNDDPAVSNTVYSITDATGTEGGSITFNVSRTGTAAGVEMINFATSDDTATQGIDYTSANGTLTFQTGDSSKPITVASLQDSDVEGDEMFDITLSALVGGSSISSASAKGTISDDDSGGGSGSGNYGIAFDAATDALVVSNFASLGNNEVTVEIDLKQTGTGGSSLAGDTPFSFATGNDTDALWVGSDSSGDIIVTTQRGDYVGNGATGFDGTRRRLTITVVGSGPPRDIQYFVDGAFVTSERPGSSWFDQSGTIVIGQKQSALGVLAGAADAFVGEIYRVRIWDRVLSNQEVAAGTATSGLVADFDFTEGSGVTTTSAVGGYVANFVGTPQWVAEGSGSGGGNQPPVAVNDSNETATQGVAEVIDPRGNDSDPDNDSLSITGTTQGSNGSVTYTSTSVTYTSNPNYVGSDNFDYTISDGNGGTDTATVTVNVTGSGGGSTTAYSVSDESTVESGTLTFTVTRTGTAVGIETINYATASGTATQGADYTAASGQLSFQVGDNSKAFTVVTNADGTFEDIETFTVTLSNLVGGGSIVDASSTGTINDGDSPPPFFIGPASASEGNLITFTVQLNGNSALNHSVDYATSPGTASQGTDYLNTSDTLTFASGETSKNFSVSTLQDADAEGDETFTVTLSNPTGGAFLSGQSSADGTIFDDENGTFSVADPAAVTEGANLVFTVTRTAGQGPQSVDYSTSSGTAIQGADYSGASGTLNFGGQDASLTITVVTTDDVDTESTETFALTLSNPTGGAAIGDGSATGTINDNDVAGSTTAYSIDDPSAIEGGTVTFTVSRTGTAVGQETIDYATMSGTATQGTDYTGASNTLAFQPSDTSKTFTVTTTQDIAVEADETFTATLSALVGGSSIADASGIGTINDDDTAASTTAYSIGNASASEGNTLTFTVSRTGTATGVETIDYATSSGTAVQGTDYTAASGMLTFQTTDTSKTFTVNSTEETTYEGSETFTVTLSNLIGGASISDATATGTITNDDTAPSFSINNKSASEGNSLTFTVTKSKASAFSHNVSYATSSGSATSGVDFVAKSGTLSFSSAQTTRTFSVSSIEDSAVESNETFNVNLSNATNGATIGDGLGIGTINNDDTSGPTTLTSSSGAVLSAHAPTYNNSTSCSTVIYQICTYSLSLDASGTIVYQEITTFGSVTVSAPGYTKPGPGMTLAVTPALYGVEP